MMVHGSYTDAVVVTDSDNLVGSESGIHAPTVLPIGDGLQLLVFHSYIETPD